MKIKIDTEYHNLGTAMDLLQGNGIKYKAIRDNEVEILEKTASLNSEQLSEVVSKVIEDYNARCESGECDVVIGEYLATTQLKGLSMEAVANVWAECMKQVEGDTIVQIFEETCLSEDLDIDEDSYRVLGI